MYTKLKAIPQKAAFGLYPCLGHMSRCSFVALLAKSTEVFKAMFHLPSFFKMRLVATCLTFILFFLLVGFGRWGFADECISVGTYFTASGGYLAKVTNVVRLPTQSVIDYGEFNQPCELQPSSPVATTTWEYEVRFPEYTDGAHNVYINRVYFVPAESCEELRIQCAEAHDGMWSFSCDGNHTNGSAINPECKPPLGEPPSPAYTPNGDPGKPCPSTLVRE